MPSEEELKLVLSKADLDIKDKKHRILPEDFKVRVPQDTAGGLQGECARGYSRRTSR